MKAENQSDTNRQTLILSALRNPDFYPHPVSTIQVEETHISRVFLTGDFVYKIKKPVDFGFLDFSTLEKRRHYCKQEISLNRRLSKEVYLEVVAITREGTGYTLNGSGEPVEYAVKMQQLPRERTMLELLRRGELSPGMLKGLGQVMTRFYQTAERGVKIDKMGSREMIWVNIEEDFVQTSPFVPAILERVKFSEMHRKVRTFLDEKRELFDRRRETGCIRDCHGDLRLGHIYFVDTIQIIDCIEFNDRFRYGDVASDLAFLAMDLDYTGFPDVAQNLLTAYARLADDPEIFLVLDFYKCYRAHVRCKVECLRHRSGDLQEREARVTKARAQSYFELAYRYADNFAIQTIWIVCGLSGSGKSTIAAELATRLNVRWHNSDVVRKKLFGLSPEESVVVPFGQSIYGPAATEQTYEQLLLEAKKDLSRGRSVIVDGTFGKLPHRKLACNLAVEMGVNIIFIECRCGLTLLRQRLTEREEEKSVSDARLQHLEEQNRAFETLNELPESLHLSINTDQPTNQSVLEIFSKAYVLGTQQGDARRKRAGGS
ncbi:MAG: AAA family ATPase [Deltaproteobacteria bacterium]|nr:AAA family ATPase [Deltaproteobacteria bacterium]